MFLYILANFASTDESYMHTCICIHISTNIMDCMYMKISLYLSHVINKCCILVFSKVQYSISIKFGKSQKSYLLHDSIIDSPTD